MKMVKTLVALAAVGGAAYVLYKKKDEILEKIEELKERDAPVIYSTEDDEHTASYEENEEGVEIDTDKNGDIDVIGVDTTGDGQLDTALMDTDGDGKIDTIATTVENPEYDAIDLDGDGKADIIVIKEKEEIDDHMDSDSDGIEPLSK